MATARILKLTNQEAVIKIDGSVGPVTINLATDLLLPTEVISGTPSVSILQMHVAGRPGGLASISRGGVNLWDLQTSTAEKIDMLSFGGTADNTNATENIVVTTSGAETQLLLKLRKNTGYLSRIRPEETGLDTPL